MPMTAQRTRINFSRVYIKALKRWKENGKPRQKTRVFEQTINPFNKNADGSVKTYDDIMKENLQARQAWLKLPHDGDDFSDETLRSNLATLNGLLS